MFELNQGAMDNDLTDAQTSMIAATVASLLNEALLLDREGISRLLKSCETVSDLLDDHPVFITKDSAASWDYDAPVTMTAIGLITSLFGYFIGMGTLVMDVDDRTGEIVIFRVKK